MFPSFLSPSPRRPLDSGRPTVITIMLTPLKAIYTSPSQQPRHHRKSLHLAAGSVEAEPVIQVSPGLNMFV